MNPPRRLLSFSSAALLLVLPASGAEHLVDSLAALKSALAEAAAGDVVTLKNGVYTTTEAIAVTVSGDPDHPITIAAESVGGVEIAGTHGFDVTGSASHIVISGFRFTHASGRDAIAGGTSDVRFTRNTFQCAGDGPYLTVTGDDAQIDHNDFRDKKSAGSMIAVAGTGAQVARRLWIHHNYFHDYAPSGSGSAEMIRFGLSTISLSQGTGTVEHNLFARCRGESEFISNRTSGNTYRYNTFVESPTARISFRHGNDCLFYGNYVRNTEGLRVFGDRHRIFSNYFEGNYIGINLGNGSTEVAEGGDMMGHDRPDNCVIVFNTLVDNRTHYQLSRRAPKGLGATNTTFANNLLAGGGVAAKIDGPYTEPVWSGNLVWTGEGPGDIPTAGYTKADPLLAKGDDGISRPQPGSPAIEAATAGFENITVDIDGQSRPEKKTIGADEPGTQPALAKFLTPADVGPDAK